MSLFAQDPYLQADSLTLKNKLGIEHDPELLDDAMTQITSRRIAQIRSGKSDIPRTFDTDHVRALHAQIFGDVFEWAGSFRSDRPMIDGTPAEPARGMRKMGSAVTFTEPERIEAELKRLSGRIARSDNLRGLSRAQFAKKSARVFADLNTIHPFREGNGRVQREFMHDLAHEAGHEIDFSVVSQERMYSASEEATSGNIKPMERLMDEITDPERCDKLRKLTGFLDSQGFDWHTHYLTTTTAGEKYRGDLGGKAGTDFFMTSENRIVVGNARDVPDTAAQGDNIVVTASPMGDQVAPRPRKTPKTTTRASDPDSRD